LPSTGEWLRPGGAKQAVKRCAESGREEETKLRAAIEPARVSSASAI